MEGVCSGEVGQGSLVRDLLEHLGDKWTLLVVGMLEAGPVRYSALKDLVPGISQRMLTLTLKKLERDGLVSRESFAEIPPRVEYRLTSLGSTLLPPALAFATWALDNSPEILASRAEYDARSGRPN
jgi:DNA-binding HxlR family transcriptional regulator